MKAVMNELEKSPEHVHTYRLTPLSLWNAAAAGITADAMLDVLGRYSKFPLPGNLASALVNHASRPLLVVPSARAAAQRIRDIREDRVPAAR